MFSSVSVKKKLLSNKETLCFLCVLEPGDNSMKSRRASCVHTLTWKFSIPNNFLTVWPIHFKFDMMVKQLKGILKMYLKIEIFGPNESRKAVKVKIGSTCVHISKHIWPTDFIFGTKIQPNEVQLMTQVPMTLNKSQGHRSRSNVQKLPKILKKKK